MRKGDEGFEFIVGSKQILGAFFLIVVLFVGGFSLGYSLGHSRGKNKQEVAFEIRGADESQGRVRLPSTSARQSFAPQGSTKTAHRVKAPTTAVGETVARGIYLQVAASRVGADARVMVQQLRAKGHSVVLQDGAHDGWFRVLVGPFSDSKAAKLYREQLKASGLDSILRNL